MKSSWRRIYINKDGVVNKVIKFILNVFHVLVVLLAIILLVPKIFSYQPYTIVSGSMEPEYSVGSIVYVKKVEPDTIEVGDAITYVLNENLVVVTHRVIDIEHENALFITKGDANETPDSQPIYFENLIGKATKTIPYLGYALVYLRDKYILGGIIAGYFSLVALDNLLETNE